MEKNLNLFLEIDNMADIINISTKKKKKVDYYSRLKKCKTRIKKTGKCECEVCQYKLFLINKLLIFILKECEDAPEPLFLGDIQEVLNVSTTKFYKIVNSLATEELIDE